MTNEEYDQSEAVFVVGQILGTASLLNTDALEKFIKKPSSDFRYAKECADVLAFVKQVRKP